MLNILVKEECESWVMHRVIAAVKRLMHSLATVFSLVCTLYKLIACLSSYNDKHVTMSVLNFCFDILSIHSILFYPS